MIEMRVRIIQCPKCLKTTLMVVATHSTITQTCSECDFKQTMLLSDCKKKEKSK